MNRRRWLARSAATLAGLPAWSAIAQAAPAADFDRLFDGSTLDGWTAIGARPGIWRVDGGAIHAAGPGQSWLSLNRPFRDFDLRLSYRIGLGGNSGVLLRAPHRGDPSFEGLEVQILDDSHPGYRHLRPDQYNGSVYGLAPAQRGAARPPGTWNRLTIRLVGPELAVDLNGVRVLAARLDTLQPLDARKHPGTTRCEGFLGLQAHGTPVWFRDLAVREFV